MKTPEEIAREIVDVAESDGEEPCALGHSYSIHYYCAGCLSSMIAAAIVAERGAGLADDGKDRKAAGKLSDPCACHDLRSGCPYSMSIESDTYDPPEGDTFVGGPLNEPKMPPAEVDRIARKAFEDYAAGRTDSRGNPRTTEPGKLDDGGARCGVTSPLSSTRDEGAGPAPASPAPACARCGGRGKIQKMSVGWMTCPECGGKP